ncbi:MAG: response regulator transcription factor [Synoicihabitans sp.]
MGLSALISSQSDMVVAHEYDAAEDLLANWSSGSGDIVLMDLRMPGLGGVEATLALLSQDPAARVIVLTTFDTDEDIFRAIQSGAKSYLLKDMSTSLVVGTIRDVFRGDGKLPEVVASRLDERERRQNLSERETEVLVSLVKGRSNKEISKALFISEETVKSHLKTLFAKLDVHDRTEAAISAIRQGVVHLD